MPLDQPGFRRFGHAAAGAALLVGRPKKPGRDGLGWTASLQVVAVSAKELLAEQKRALFDENLRMEEVYGNGSFRELLFNPYLITHMM